MSADKCLRYCTHSLFVSQETKRGRPSPSAFTLIPLCILLLATHAAQNSLLALNWCYLRQEIDYSSCRELRIVARQIPTPASLVPAAVLHALTRTQYVGSDGILQILCDTGRPILCGAEYDNAKSAVTWPSVTREAFASEQGSTALHGDDLGPVPFQFRHRSVLEHATGSNVGATKFVGLTLSSHSTVKSLEHKLQVMGIPMILQSLVPLGCV